MNDEQFDGLKERILKVNTIIKELDDEIKKPAFDILKPFILQASNLPTSSNNILTGNDAEHSINVDIPLDGLNDYYLLHKPDKPAEAAHILAGWLYKNRGNQSFALKDVESLFDSIGEPRPSRLDMTFKAAQKSGKKLYQPAGKGMFKLTVNGENYFKVMFKNKEASSS